MTNVDVANMKPGEFSAAYEKIKINADKNPINSSVISLDDQLNKFESASFSAEDDRVLHADLLSL